MKKYLLVILILLLTSSEAHALYFTSGDNVVIDSAIDDDVFASGG
jgi:hypothetical protein